MAGILLAVLVVSAPYVLAALTFSKTTIESNLGTVDAIDYIDIDGDGDVDILAGAETGAAYWYENIGGGTFTKRTIRGSSITGGSKGNTKHEGALWGDLNHDGHYEAIFLDQRSGIINIFSTDTPGDYDGTWTLGNVHNTDNSSSERIGFLQDARMLDVDDDGDLDLFISYEGFYTDEDQANYAGFAWFEYVGEDVLDEDSYTYHKVLPVDTAWFMSRDLYDFDGDGNADDFVFSARNSDSRLKEGIYIALNNATNTWTYATVTNTNRDWLHVDVGDFFGNSHGLDIVAHAYDGTLQIFDYENAWAATTIVTNTDQARYAAMTYPYKTNGYDRIFSSGGVEGFGTTRDAVIWYWNGAAWAAERIEEDVVSKADDRTFLFDIDGTEPKEIMQADGGLSDIYYFTMSDLVYTVDPPAYYNASTILNMTIDNLMLSQ